MTDISVPRLRVNGQVAGATIDGIEQPGVLQAATVSVKKGKIAYLRRFRCDQTQTAIFTFQPMGSAR
ncbi:hypothetical protein GCM10010493_77550 [Streptomyces lavendulae subsp. grasserius]